MKNPNVFELIKAMNMSEKRQFKIYSSRHVIEGENKYMLLFTLLERMEIFDQDLLANSLKDAGKKTAFIKADMNFLYQSILKSLVLYHSGKSAQIILNESISIIEILYFKGNFEQCIKEINKAANIARNAELFSSLLKIIQYEKTVYNHLSKHNRTEHDIIQDLIYIHQIQQNIITYYDLHNTANQARIRIIKTRNTKEISIFEKLMQHELLQHEQRALSLDAKIKFYQIHAMWHYVNQEKKDELNTNKKIIQLFEKHPIYKDEHLIEYVNTYARILSISKDINEQVFFIELHNFRSIEVQNEKLYFLRISAQIFNFSYMIELSMYIQKKKFAKAANIINDIEYGLKKYKTILIASYKITFLYMLAYYYFATGNFDNARKRINTLLNEHKEEERPDIYNFAKLINLLIHFELKNFSYIKYKQQSVFYYFKKQSSLYETENIILKFFSLEKNYTVNLEKSLLKLKADLEKTKNHSLEKYAFNYFDWIDWIDSKISKKSCIAKLYL
ncbi:MAG TPA: hypothetical protein PK431_09390 [Chitinophagales bacterium]|nr:hypothetical protein [Chitinophagales bacterium]